MDVLGTRLGLSKVLAINVNGLKIQRCQIDDAISNYITAVKAAGINPAHVWSDYQDENIYSIHQRFDQLLNNEHIVYRRAAVLRCPCGIVEMLEAADNLSCRRKLYRQLEGVAYCQFCNQPVSKFDELVYLFRFPDIENSIIAEPVFYATELRKMAAKFKGNYFLISRKRQSAFPLWSGQNNLYLDVDFIWYLLLPILSSFDFQADVVVGGAKTLMACCFIAAMSEILLHHSPTFVIAPYCYAEGGVPLKQAFGHAQEFFAAYGAETVRLFLATGLNWRKKESTLEARLLPLLQKLSYRMKSCVKPYHSVSQALAELDGIEVKKMIGHTRKTPGDCLFDKLYGIV